jgi:hypothetical protein
VVFVPRFREASSFSEHRLTLRLSIPTRELVPSAREGHVEITRANRTRRGIRLIQVPTPPSRKAKRRVPARQPSSHPRIDSHSVAAQREASPFAYARCRTSSSQIAKSRLQNSREAPEQAQRSREKEHCPFALTPTAAQP